MIRGCDSANMAGNRYFAVSTRGTATAVVKGNAAAGDPENCSTVLPGRFGSHRTVGALSLVIHACMMASALCQSLLLPTRFCGHPRHRHGALADLQHHQLHTHTARRTIQSAAAQHGRHRQRAAAQPPKPNSGEVPEGAVPGPAPEPKEADMWEVWRNLSLGPLSPVLRTRIGFISFTDTLLHASCSFARASASRCLVRLPRTSSRSSLWLLWLWDCLHRALTMR